MRRLILVVSPERAALLLNGKATIEVRKSIPDCELPCEVLVYVAKKGSLLFKERTTGEYFAEEYNKNFRPSYALNGKVVAKFVLKDFDRVCVNCKWNGENYRTHVSGENHVWAKDEMFEKSKLSTGELLKYLGANSYGYAWFINELSKLEKPMELKEIYHMCDGNCEKCKHNSPDLEYDICNHVYEPLTGIPHGWRYV